MRKISFFLTALLCCLLTMSFAQTKELTGKITDSSGNAVPGASVRIRGVKGGVSADANGEYKINAPANAVLIISGIGFETQEIRVGNSQNMNIFLKHNASSLNEVVVTALGIKREKRKLGVATQTIGNDQLNKSGTGNPLSEMNGKVSGLTVINSAGDPGAGTYIRLRGVNSITGDNQPLIVIDGIPVDNSINNFDAEGNGFGASNSNGNLTGGAQPTNRGLDVNPNDIESVNVLKGPAASALWGMKGANGVILVTTKKGAGRRGTSVTFNSSVTMDKISQVPGLQNQYAKGSNGVYLGPEDGSSSTSWGPNMDTLLWDGNANYKWDKNGAIVGKSDPTGKTPVHPYNQYDFFQKGFTTNNNVALSGSNDKSNFRLSLGNLYQTGVIPTSKYNKTTVNLSGESKITDKLHATASILYTNSYNKKVQQGSNVSGIMLGLTRTPPSFDNSDGFSNAADHPEAYIFPDGTQRNYRGGIGYNNPYWTVNEAPTTSDLNRILGSIQADYQLLSWMTLTYRLGGDIYSQSDKIAYNVNDESFPLGAVVLVDYLSTIFNSDFIVNMHKSFSKDFEGSLIVGNNFYSKQKNTRFAEGQQLAIPGFLDMSNASTYQSSEGELRKATMAFYAEADLNYKKQLYLTLTGRRETSSTLPAANDVYYYPSAALSWIFTELPGLKNGNILSFGKLRASYADVAQDPPPYALTTPYSTATFADGWTGGITFPFNGIPGYQLSSGITTVGNTNLKPENTRSVEFGADLSFLRNRIGLNVTAYYSKTTDDILPVSLPNSTGFGAIELNAASLSNKGLEVTLNTTPVQTKDFRWDVNFNWSRNISKVLQLYPGVNELLVGGFGGGEAEVAAIPGQPFGVLYGATQIHASYNTKGSTPTNDLKAPVILNDAPGDPGFAQPLTDAGPLQVIGNPNPQWLGSVISNFSYKKFTFSFQIDIRHGGDMWNGTRGALEQKGTSQRTANRGQSVTFKGQLGHLDANGNLVHYAADGVTELAGAGAANTNSSVYTQYYWQNIQSSFGAPTQEVDVENAGFTRVRQVSLSYDLPNTIFGKNTFTRVSFTVFANNLFLWTKYDGVDPETSLGGPANAQGLDYFNNPGTKTYGVRLNLGL